jgi:hypothetical protein
MIFSMRLRKTGSANDDQRTVAGALADSPSPYVRLRPKL